jgi:hypothetical protein
MRSDIVYGEEEKRSFLKLNAVSLLVTFGVIVVILLTLAAVVALPAVLNYISPSGVTAFLVKIGRWPILFVLVTLALAVLYRYGPSRTEPQWLWITWGSVFCRDCMAYRLGRVLMVCRELWQLQQDVRFSRRNRRIYDLDLAVDHRRFGRS